MVTRYAKWLSTCSGYCECNVTRFMCVGLEWNCQYVFFSVSFVVFLLMFCLLMLPYYVVNKDEYITHHDHRHLIILT